jgi:hypothetical protein
MARAKSEGFSFGNPTDYSGIVCTDLGFCRDFETCVQVSSFFRQTKGIKDPEEIQAIGADCSELCSFFQAKFLQATQNIKPPRDRNKSLDQLQVELAEAETAMAEVERGERTSHPLRRRIINLRQLVKARQRDNEST